MPKKVLFAEGGGVDGLKSLHTSDKEGLGVLFEDEYGRIYRYVKNAGATSLQQSGVCLKKLGATTAKGTLQRVLAPDAATGPATCMPSVIAGVPVTGIAPSGSATGDHGWIQVSGPAKVTMWQSATPTQQEAGCLAIASSVTSAGVHCWDKPVTQVIDSTNGGSIWLNCVRLVESLTTTGVATAASAIVNIFCLN